MEEAKEVLIRAGFLAMHEEWLEYSIEHNAVFCFPCRMFRQDYSQSAFTSDGFSSWNKATERFRVYNIFFLINLQTQFINNLVNHIVPWEQRTGNISKFCNPVPE